MGQRVQAIVYGVVLSEEQLYALQELDGEWACGMPQSETQTEDGADFIGIAVAVQNVPRNSEIDIPKCRVSKIVAMVAPQVELAKPKWNLVVAWARKNGVELHEPELLLVEIQRP